MSTDETSSDNNVNNDTLNSKKLNQVNSVNNYWLEVYLEEEKMWIPFDPKNFEESCNLPSYFENRFSPNNVLYVCSFDNENKVKDVTKRYASKWTTVTRLLRISHLEEKKLWWEKTLLAHQIYDVNLDMEEEQQLKSKYT